MCHKVILSMQKVKTHLPNLAMMSPGDTTLGDHHCVCAPVSMAMLRDENTNGL
jgi:hypothetical protein